MPASPSGGSHGGSLPPSPKKSAIPQSSTVDEHTEWAQALWNRMDRNNNGYITAEELNCDEFQCVLRGVMVPSYKGEGGLYSRSEINIQQAISFCLRKADMNKDGSLSFAEFKAFLRVLRNQGDAKHTANLIFALFDLDMSLSIDKNEFREIYRYYLGRHPTSSEFEAEWGRLDCESKGCATRPEYIKWLQRSANPVFKQHAPPVEATEDFEEPNSECLDADVERKIAKGIQRPAPGILPHLRRRANPEWKPDWNARLNPKDIVATNPCEAPRRKAYFSRPASLPDLHNFLRDHRGFEANYSRLKKPKSPRVVRVLSTDNAAMPEIIQDREKRAGNMTNSTGQPVQWTDLWQTPPSMKKSKRDPGSLLLRCAGEPPEWMKKGRDDEHKQCRLKAAQSMGSLR